MVKNNFSKKASVEGRGITLKVMSIRPLKTAVDTKLKGSIPVDRSTIGTVYKVRTNFSPGSHPGFTNFLDNTYRLLRVHNNTADAGFYLVGVEDKHKDDFLNVLTKAIDDISIIDINASERTAHQGLKS